MHRLARGAVIEIIERRSPEDLADDSPSSSIVVPTEVRINGQQLLHSAEEPVRVHGVTARGDQAVLVTLTLFARRVVIGAEPHEHDPRAMPVKLRVGGGVEYEIGTVDDPSAVPALLRAAADYLEADQSASTTD